MALQKQLVPLPPTLGLDTKTDSKQEEPGYFRVAENIVYETLKLLKKRNGYGTTSLDVLASTTKLAGSKKLAKFGTELLALTNGALFSYSESRMSWTQKGVLYSAQTNSNVIYKSAGSQSCADGIVVDRFKVFTFEDDVGGVRYSVQDLVTKSFLVSNGLVEAGAERPVVAAIQNDVYVLYGNGADLKFKSFSILEPQTLSTATVVASDRHLMDGTIDMRTCGTAIACAYNSDNGGDDLVIFKINSDGSTSSLVGLNSESASDALNIYCDAQSRIVVTYSDGTDFKVVIYAFNLNAALLAPTLVESIAVSTCAAISNGANYKLYYEVVQGGTADNYVKQADLTLAGVVSNKVQFVRSVGLAADPFTWNSVTYIPVVFESALQSTYFLYNAAGMLVTKWANQTASGVITTGVIASSTVASDSTILMAALFRNRTKSNGQTFFSTNGIGSVEINFEPATCYSNAELAGNLHICAGLLKMYDGATVTEHGFQVFPEALSNPSNSVTGGHLTDGSRGYKAVYKWTDNNGKDHRSAPTLLELDVVLAGGGAVQESTIRVPTLRITEKENVVIELYRTEKDGTNYYKVTDDSDPVLSVKTADYVDIVDGLSDTALISNEALYTTGDVLENVPAPAAFQVTAYNGDRLVVVGEQGHRVYFSKQVTEEQPVEFTDTIYRDIDPVGGPVTALANMAAKLVVFEEDACYYIQGEGPTNTGVQDTLTKPEILATDVGCTNSDSVILTPAGLMFKSRKGIQFCAAALSISYVGDRVEAFNSATITSAAIVGELNQVRFLLSENRALVFNYNLNRWGTFENHAGLSSIVIGDQYWYLKSDGEIWQEDRTNFSDVGTPIKLRFETGWLSADATKEGQGGLQSFARVYQAFILATFKSAHKLRVRIAYDFVDAWVQDVVVDPLNFIDPTAYGDDAFYGATSPYGGAGNLYQFRVDLERQKCTSIKIQVEDIQSVASEGLTISGITLRTGTKVGGNKLQASQQVGTE